MTLYQILKLEEQVDYKEQAQSLRKLKTYRKPSFETNEDFAQLLRWHLYSCGSVKHRLMLVKHVL